ncbi:unnamed protein product [Calypogeia fissa]
MSFKEQDIPVSVQVLCFTKEIIPVTFNRPRDQERIDDAVDLINQGYLSPRAFPTMNVVEFHNRLWSLDNRRLWVFKKAKLPSITVTLQAGYEFHHRLKSLLSNSRKLYKMFSSPNFFPRIRGHCKENFDDDPDPDLQPSSLSPPPTPRVRTGGGGGGHFESPSRVYKHSTSSPAPHVRADVREQDRPPKRPKCPPSPSMGTKLSSPNPKSKHFHGEFQSDDYHNVQPCHSPNCHCRNRSDHHYHDQSSKFRTQHSDHVASMQQPRMPMRGPVITPPWRNFTSAHHGPSLVNNTKKRHHDAEHRHRSAHPPQGEASSPRPSKKHRAPSQAREFMGTSSPPPPPPPHSCTPIEEHSSHLAKESKSKNPTQVREFNASSPPSARRPQLESEWPPSASPSTLKSLVPTPREKPKASRIGKEAAARPPSLVRTTRAAERKADPPGNFPSSRRITDRKVSGQIPPLDKRPAVFKDNHSQKGREAQGSTSRAAEKPPPPPAQATRKGKSSKATSNPKNFSYDFHSSRKRPKASKGSKKTTAAAQQSTNSSSTQNLVDNGVDASAAPSHASRKTQRASPSSEEPPEPELLSCWTTASLSTRTKKMQNMDENFPSGLTDPKGNPEQKDNPAANPKGGQQLGSAMSPTAKTGQEQSEAPDLVDVAVPEGELLSETEKNLFKLDKEETRSVDPELSPLPPTPSTILDPSDQQVMNEILEQLLKDKEIARQTAQTTLTVDTQVQKKPVEGGSPNDFQTFVDVVIEQQHQLDEPQHFSVEVDVQESIVDCPIECEVNSIDQFLESAPKVSAFPAFHGDGDVQMDANVSVSGTTAGLEPPEIPEVSTPVKDVLEPVSEIKEGSVVDQLQQTSTPVTEVLEPKSELEAESAIDQQQASTPVKEVLEPQSEIKAVDAIAQQQASTPIIDVLEPNFEAKAYSAIDHQQASTPVKDVLESNSKAKAASAIGQQQGRRCVSWRSGYREMARTANSEITRVLTKSTQAIPIFGNEVQESPKRITRGQLKKHKETERRKEREKRKVLKEAEKSKEREAKGREAKEREVKEREVKEREAKQREAKSRSRSREKSVSATKRLTTAIVPYDGARSKATSSGQKVQTGDMAYVKINGELAAQESGIEGQSKLHPYLRFLGPFRVSRRCNAYAAQLELPDDCCLKKIFSLTVLTKSMSPLENCSPDIRLSITLVPEIVLKKRVARRLRKKKEIHYLVKWKTLPATEATWEPATIFEEHPHLLDQVDDSPLFSNPYLLRNWKA